MDHTHTYTEGLEKTSMFVRINFVEVQIRMHPCMLNINFRCIEIFFQI